MAIISPEELKRIYETQAAAVGIQQNPPAQWSNPLTAVSTSQYAQQQNQADRINLFNDIMQQNTGSYNYNPYKEQEYQRGLIFGQRPMVSSEGEVAPMSKHVIDQLYKGGADIAMATAPTGLGVEALFQNALEKKLIQWAMRPGTKVAGKELSALELLMEKMGLAKKQSAYLDRVSPIARRRPPDMGGGMAELFKENPRGPYRPGTAGYAMEQESVGIKELIDRIKRGQEIIDDIDKGLK